MFPLSFRFGGADDSHHSAAGFFSFRRLHSFSMERRVRKIFDDLDGDARKCSGLKTRPTHRGTRIG